MTNERKSPWNSLEVAKLCAGLLTPFVVALVGYFIQQQLAEQSRTWQVQQRLADRRLQVYDSIRSDLNRIYCFVEDVGSWKEDNPETVVGYKRSIDRTMHTQRAIWATDTFHAYLEYMDAAFQTYQAVGTDARIKTNDIEKRVGVPGWTTEWSARLTGQRDPNHRSFYNRLVNLMSRDLSLAKSDGGEQAHAPDRR